MRRLLIVLSLILAAGGLGSACSTSTDIDSAPATSTTKTPSTVDPLDAAALATGNEAIQKLQSIVNGMLASSDPCAVLTQRDLDKNKLDPSLFTSSAARKVVTKGLVDVYDHLIQISPVDIKAPLAAQKAVLTDVLAVVDQYATDPNSTKATKQIDSLVSAPGYVAAQTTLTAWVTTNCR